MTETKVTFKIVKIPPYLHKRLKVKSSREEKTLQDTIEKVLIKGLKEECE